MTWWQYLMLVNIYLLLFYGFYGLLLSRETFFQLNRIYLVTAALLSFFIPLIQSDWVKNLFITQKVQYTIYSNSITLNAFKPIPDEPVTIGQLLVIVYLAGIVLLLGRFAWQLITLNKVIDQPEPATAYSFFKKIKLGEDISDEGVIAAHEQAHASQWHSADVLIMEAVMIINWFNPVVYLYRFAIKHIHEFIADRQALKSGASKADYAMLLLSQTFNAPAHQLVNPFFNKSLLKQRIIMLQKNKSQRIALVKYCLSAPLFILMLVLSSATVNNSKSLRLLNRKVEQVLLTPATENAGAIQSGAGPVKPAVDNDTSKHAQKALVTISIAQPAVADTTKKDSKVFTSVEQTPEFPGGFKAFMAFLASNIKFPALARKNKVQGRVIISFIVETDGSLSDVRVVRSLEDDADQEAVRVLKLSPKWTPGTQNGHPVRVSYTVPINFSLAKDDKPSGEKVGYVGDGQEHTVTLGAMSIIVSKTDTGSSVIEINPKDPAHAPVYVLDGKEVSSLTTLNPDDIASITVLKDKASTVLYGPKGANGVVVITTKGNTLNLRLTEPPKDKQ